MYLKYYHNNVRAHYFYTNYVLLLHFIQIHGKYHISSEKKSSDIQVFYDVQLR